MNRVWRSILVVISLVLVLGAAQGWSQQQQTYNPTASDGLGNTAGGNPALPKDKGSNNTAFGHRALALNTTGFQNTASGSHALLSNTTGNYNTANGVSALSANSSGSENTASGTLALRSNTTGRQNTANGVSALYNNNTGDFNTASGFQALAANTTGENNTASGFKALLRNTSGSYNIAVGFEAGQNLTSGNNNIYLGNQGVATESNTMRLGTTHSTYIPGILSAPQNAGAGAQVLINPADGQLGYLASSARYKRDIHAIGARSQGLFQLRPVSFRYKQDSQGQRQYGLIAEEVVKVYPELVIRGADGKVETVQYQALIPLLLNELQHQRQELGVQARQMAELKAQNESLRAAMGQLASLQAQNQRLQAAVEQLQVRAETQRATTAALAGH
jgi:hypothetical protein